MSSISTFAVHAGPEQQFDEPSRRCTHTVGSSGSVVVVVVVVGGSVVVVVVVGGSVVVVVVVVVEVVVVGGNVVVVVVVVVVVGTNVVVVDASVVVVVGASVVVVGASEVVVDGATVVDVVVGATVVVVTGGGSPIGRDDVVVVTGGGSPIGADDVVVAGRVEVVAGAVVDGIGCGRPTGVSPGGAVVVFDVAGVVLVDPGAVVVSGRLDRVIGRVVMRVSPRTSVVGRVRLERDRRVDSVLSSEPTRAAPIPITGSAMARPTTMIRATALMGSSF
ncbi:MAG: hypothetical protein KJO17_04175 [Acidimicrobiia bacterium]|nr:hypothetical protein [Acidimicrobiia bacterium]